MYSTNTADTLILPNRAPACPARKPGELDPVAAIQYHMLVSAPYRYTSDDLITRPLAWQIGYGEAEYPDFRADYLMWPREGLEASPLVQTYGWAIHCDDACHAALVDPASARFAELTDTPALHKTPSGVLAHA